MSDLKTFVSYFRRELDVIRSLGLPETSRQADLDLALHRKVLSLAMLESLAAIRFRTQGNRDRFHSLICDHASWRESSWVSVPILFARLAVRDTALHKDLATRLARHSTEAGNSLPLSAFDGPPDEFRRLAADEEERTQINRATHLNLLWAFRNFVVHEFREPGYSMEAFGEGSTEPCYHGYLNDSSWHLLYPVGFFLATAATVIEDLQSHYERGGLNPYSEVYDSSLWQQS